MQRTRAILTSTVKRNPDNPERGAEKIYEFAGVKIPPLRFVLGGNSPDYVIRKLDKVKEEIEAYRQWSEGLKSEK